MSRLSFEKKRAQGPVARRAAVRVRVSGTGGASMDGTAVAAAPGEDIQQTVLNHLHRLAISLGAPVSATIHDDRTGCVVPLEVATDGSSRVTGAPVRLTPPAAPRGPAVPRTPAVPRASVEPSTPVAPSALAVSSVPVAPGTVQAPTGVFGPAPVMDSVRDSGAVRQTGITPIAFPEPEAAPVPNPAPTPPRGFDAIAEEVLGDEPVTETVEGAELLAGPMARINEAVREGRIEVAAELAERAVAEASAVLGDRHREVLHLRELTAYIAYLAGDPARAFRLSLDTARGRREVRDAEAAYGNVRSAATAWRAVRDPEEGLRMGRELIGLWTELTAEPGPAADDPRPLESARTRMVRLTDRAGRAAAQA
ncbi:hypothetical protein OIB37_21575 [Streptomyces sp. NBC_00820]|uniref:tetratricopeptide repeat protein n=1 Tax=Streptomyces sp. NBC_00820 TaxID=2975842 RepID=UPI002ED52978|nr:hypothetical protein OIB37_21575 [Streptomyces sp. NBC_00820]